MSIGMKMHTMTKIVIISGQFKKCHMGRFTPTTKSRLNALINEFCEPRSNGIFQKNWNWYVRAFNTIVPFHDGISIPVV